MAGRLVRRGLRPDAGTIKNHPEHTALFAAVLRELNQRLWEAAATEGESRGDDLRITFIDPFVVDFQVYPADRRVLILSVRLRTYLI